MNTPAPVSQEQLVDLRSGTAMTIHHPEEELVNRTLADSYQPAQKYSLVLVVLHCWSYCDESTETTEHLEGLLRA